MRRKVPRTLTKGQTMDDIEGPVPQDLVHAELIFDVAVAAGIPD